jgi:hypothetical protein
MHLARQLSTVLLALPLAAAAAEPVRITTHMSGHIDAFPLILEAMGFGDYWSRPGPLPFALAIESIVDPDDAADWCSSNNWCYSLPASVSYSLTIDGKTVGFTDTSTTATIAWNPAWFLHGISYSTVPYPATSGYFVSLESWVDGPPGSVKADPFAPQALMGPVITGNLTLSVMPLDPEVPGLYGADARADSVRFQVSAVPAPPGAAMLAAGLAALAMLGSAGSRRPLPARRSCRRK